MKLKKQLVIRALTDPKFRKLLEENPEAALTKEELEEIKGGVADVIDQASIIDIISLIIAPMIFCIDLKPDPNLPSDPFQPSDPIYA